MRNFALTYPQLMNQAIAAGWDEASLSRLKCCHDLALSFFDGFYRAQGSPFICHLVRTASIVLAEKQPVDSVLAALLHSGYLFGQPETRKPKLRQLLGDPVESLIAEYKSLPWREENAVREHSQNFTQYPESKRRLLVLRLANELEDHLDDGMVYRHSFSYREWIETRGEMIVSLARSLASTSLADELQESFNKTLARKLPEGVKCQHGDAYELIKHKRMRLGWVGRIRARVKRQIKQWAH